MGILGIVPALATAADIPALAQRMGYASRKHFLTIVDQAMRHWVKSHTREYDPNGGDLGRGECIPVNQVRALLPHLKDLGFAPYLALSWQPDSQFHPVYGSSGALCALIWYAFVRERDGKHEIIAFEHTDFQIADYHQRTGLTLVEAINL